MVFAVLVGAQYIQSRLTISDLTEVTGTIKSTERVTYWAQGRSGHWVSELRVFLTDKPDYFRIMGVYDFLEFSDQIIAGESVKLYVRPGWLAVIGMGYKYDIMHLEIKDVVLLDISRTRRNSQGIIFVGIFSIIIFVLLGIFGKKIAMAR